MIRQPREEGCQSWTLPTLQGPLASTTCPLPSPQGASGPLPLPLPGENYSFPLLDKHHHILYFPPLLLESTERFCGPCLWTPPPRGQRTGGDTTPEVWFPPQSQSSPPEVKPHATGSHEPATLHGAAQPHPVWMPRSCFRGCPTCGPSSQEDGCLPPPCQLHRRAHLCPHPQTRNPPPTPPAAGLQPHLFRLQSRGSQPPTRIRTRFLPHLWDPQWGPVGGCRLPVVLCRHPGAAPPPTSIRTLLSEGGKIDILSSREETEAQGAHEVAGGHHGAPRPGPGQSSRGIRRAGRAHGQVGKGFTLYNTNPKPSSGVSEPTDTQTWPWGHPWPPPWCCADGSLPSSSAPPRAPTLSLCSSCSIGPEKHHWSSPSVRVSSLWGAEWLSQWL